MLANIPGVLALDLGTYSEPDEQDPNRRVTHKSGALVRYLDVYDRDAGSVARWALAESVDPQSLPAPGTPTPVNLDVNVSYEAARQDAGRMRQARWKFQIVAVHLVGAPQSANGRRDREPAAA